MSYLQNDQVIYSNLKSTIMSGCCGVTDFPVCQSTARINDRQCLIKDDGEHFSPTDKGSQ